MTFTLAEVWNGTKWSVVKTPDPSGAAGSNFTAAACTSTSSCIAVGSYTLSSDSDVALTLAEKWNGTKWSLA
jgi:hypothetical protein